MPAHDDTAAELRVVGIKCRDRAAFSNLHDLEAFHTYAAQLGTRSKSVNRGHRPLVQIAALPPILVLSRTS